MLAMGAALCWSPHSLLAHRVTSQGTPLLVFYFHVLLWAALASLALVVLTGRMDELSVFKRRESRFLLLVLCGGYGLWLLRGLALDRSPQNPTGTHMIFLLGPLLLGLLSMPTRRGARGRQIAMLALGFAGCVGVLASARTDGLANLLPGFWGSVLALGTALCWAVFTIIVRKFARDERVLPVGAVLWSMGAACLLITCLSRGENVLEISRSGLWISMVLGAGTVALGFGLWMRSLGEVPPAYAAPVWYMTAVFGVFWTYLIEDSVPNWWTVGGVILILLVSRSGRSTEEQSHTTISDVIRG